MADYLERLARRTMGQLDVVRPDLAPVFGASAIDVRDRQSEASFIPAFANPRSALDGQRSNASARHVPNDDDTSPGPFTGAVRITPTRSSAESRSMVEATFARSEIADQSPVMIDASTPDPRPLPALRLPVREPAARVRATVAASHVSLPRESERPSVSITIGRIDVRAMPAPAQPQVSRSRPSALRTLETYLAERNGGRS